MPKDAAAPLDRVQRARATESAVVHRRTHRGIALLARLVGAAEREDADAARRERAEQLLEHASVLRERHVPDAVPRGDEIVGPRRLPLADVGEVEAHLRMPPSRE